MTRRLYLYPGWLRAWHWINAILFMALILTGLSMHYADMDNPFLSFRIATAVHNITGLVLVGMYLIFLVANFTSGNRRHYVPQLKGLFSRLFRQIHFYLFGIMRGDDHPFEATEESKFNPMQQLAYITIMFVMMPILLITGLLLQIPELAPDKFLGAGGIWPMAVAHSVVAFLMTVFTLVHIYLGSTGHTVNAYYKNMITGWHEHPVVAPEESKSTRRRASVTREKS